MKGKDRKIGLTSSGIMTILVVSMVFFSLLAGIVVFVTTYRASMIQNVKTSSDQAAVQVERIVDNYMDDISSSLKLIEGFFLEEDPVRDVNLNHMADIRSDVTAITSYDPETGELTGAWTGHKVFKKDALANLSFNKEEMPELGEIVISRPHVESLLLNEYPGWCQFPPESGRQTERNRSWYWIPDFLRLPATSIRLASEATVTVSSWIRTARSSTIPSSS